ncbi:MAG: pyridoxamine 5'-phosphate oxidase family protein, partial [Candidatus Omnitrophica bacterium]|nr:pyridoxamine 5'-phosphate oxidase family protein [Candidatus Omnitrophota bacterium]
PKFLLKHEKDSIYLVDYTKGRSYYNLERNSRISIPVMDFDTLVGYQINGQAAILEDGFEYRSLAK